MVLRASQMEAVHADWGVRRCGPSVACVRQGHLPHIRCGTILTCSTPTALYFLVYLQIIFCLASVVEIDFEAIDLVTIFSKDLACNFLRSSCIYGKGI